MRFRPHPYQRKCIQALLEHPCYGLFLDMGLGKTVITLSAIAELMYDRFEVSRVLIIAPRAVAESTWQDEAAKWDHTRGLTFSTVLGSAQERVVALQKTADCYVINRENVVWLFESAGKIRPKFDMLVVDESTSLKSPQAKRFKALKRHLPEFKRRVILTGTPAPNTLTDLWSQVYILDRGQALGQTVTGYRRTYFKPGRSNGHIVYEYLIRDKAAEHAIYNRLAPICLSLSAADYLTLPERIDNVIRVRMPAGAQEQYKKLKRNLVLDLSGEELTASTAAVLSNKLLQMANGAIYSDDGRVVHIHDAKLDALSDIIEANPGKSILVFYKYRHDLDRLQSAFPEAVQLEGQETMSEWNAGRIPLLLAHPASCGYGLNLQAGGNIIVWFGLTWSLEEYQQANARLYRQGQTSAVIIHHIVATGTMDEAVMRALQQKRVGQDALLQAVKAELAI